MKRLIVIRALVEVPDSKGPNQLEVAARQATEGVKKNLRVYNFSTVGAEFSFGSPTREEAIRLTPRKIHYGFFQAPVCSDRVVSKTYLTEDWEKVTCKSCIKMRSKIGTQRELFAP